MLFHVTLTRYTFVSHFQHDAMDVHEAGAAANLVTGEQLDDGDGDYYDGDGWV